MTIFQRKVSGAFRQGHAAQWGTQHNPASMVTDALPQGGQCGTTAAPWEGLYLEAAAEAEDNVVSGRSDLAADLERFLASIIYGE